MKITNYDNLSLVREKVKEFQVTRKLRVALFTTLTFWKQKRETYCRFPFLKRVKFCIFSSMSPRNKSLLHRRRFKGFPSKSGL